MSQKLSKKVFNDRPYMTRDKFQIVMEAQIGAAKSTAWPPINVAPAAGEEPVTNLGGALLALLLISSGPLLDSLYACHYAASTVASPSPPSRMTLC